MYIAVWYSHLAPGGARARCIPRWLYAHTCRPLRPATVAVAVPRLRRVRSRGLQDFRESSERLKEELGSLSRSLEHLQALPRHALLFPPPETGVDKGGNDAALAWPTQPAAPTPGRHTDATAPAPPGSAERLHFTQRSHQLEHVLKERDARIHELALELEGVREEEDARTADLRRLLDLPSDGQELTASVASALMALRSNHEAELMAVRLVPDARDVPVLAHLALPDAHGERLLTRLV